MESLNEIKNDEEIPRTNFIPPKSKKENKTYFYGRRFKITVRSKTGELLEIREYEQVCKTIEKDN